MTAAMATVEPAAAVELVTLIQQQLRRLIKEHHREANTQPNLAYQLEGALESPLRDLPITGRWTPTRSHGCATRCRSAAAST